VWADGPDTIIPTCNDFEERLIKLLWRARPGFGATPSSSHPASYADSNSAHSLIGVTSRGSAAPSERRVPVGRSTPVAHTSKEDVEKAFTKAVGEPQAVRTVKRRWYGKRVVVEEQQFPDAGEKSENQAENELGYGPEKRPAMLYAPLYNGLAAGLAIGKVSRIEPSQLTQTLFTFTVFIGNGVSECANSKCCELSTKPLTL
jgi:hypothetical protein